MPSTLDNMAAADFDRGIPEVKETVTRRIGGQAERTESVEAVVELDDGQGLVVSQNGKMIEVGGRLEVSASQANSGSDQWVIRGEVYHQLGEPTGKDGGSQTIVLTKRKGIVAKEPRIRQ